MDNGGTSSSSVNNSNIAIFSSEEKTKKKSAGGGGKVVKLSTDPQSVAARERRHRISDRFKILQSLVPGGAKMDTVSMLDEAIHYVKFLKTQIWLHQTMINFAAVGGDDLHHLNHHPRHHPNENLFLHDYNMINVQCSQPNHGGGPGNYTMPAQGGAAGDGGVGLQAGEDDAFSMY